MKGLKCFRLTRFLSMRYCFFLVFALFCSFFCSQLSVFFASAYSVLDGTGISVVRSFTAADSIFFPSASGCSSGWFIVSDNNGFDCRPVFKGSHASVALYSQAYSLPGVHITSNMFSGGSLVLEGSVTLGAALSLNLSSYTYGIDDLSNAVKLNSNFKGSPFTADDFSVGLSSSGSDVYNANSLDVSDVSCEVLSVGQYKGSYECKVRFTATFNNWFSTGDNFYFNYRLDGRDSSHWSSVFARSVTSGDSSISNPITLTVKPHVSTIFVTAKSGNTGGGSGGGGDTPSTGSLNLSGHSSYYWFGFSNYNAALADHYDYFTDWKLVNTVFNSRNFPGSGVQRWAVKNVSHSASGITISSNMVDSNGYASLSGYVDLVNIFDEAYRTDSGYVVKNIDSSYRLFDASAFSLGFGDTPNVSYNNGQSVCSSVTMQNLSNPINSGYGSVVRYRLSFSGCRVKASAGTNKYFSWRLNGNNATNGGKGSYFAPYIYKTNGTSQWLKYYGSPSEYKLTFTTYSGGGTTTPGQPTDPDNPDNPSNPSAPDYSDNLNDINNSLNDVNNSINNQTQQDKEQYDSEKKEENDRENAGKEDADTAQGIFNFNILNPFAPLFEMFNPNQCTNIPILSSMIGSEDKQYCSWFSQSTRSILTPAFGIVSIMLLFGFVVHWLGGSNVITFEGGA